MSDSTQQSREYYEGIFSERDHEQWEKAPGKSVIIAALCRYVEEGKVGKGSRLIDIGCGTGFLLERIRAEVSGDLNLYGVDFSAKAIDKGRTQHPGLRLFCEDGTKTHFADGEFDVVVSYGTYEHFESPENGIREGARILRKGGIFLGMMPTLGIDRTDRDDEGWYEERPVPGSPIRQMQWNLKRPTWESFFVRAGIRLFDLSKPAEFGALKPGVFFMGEKPD